jgi:hypothetical protein
MKRCVLSSPNAQEVTDAPHALRPTQATRPHLFVMTARQGANAHNDLWGKVIGHEGAEGLVLFGNEIGAEGAGSLADILGQCALGNTDSIWIDTDRGITEKADSDAETINVDRELVTENLTRLNLSRCRDQGAPELLLQGTLHVIL